jgi:hypothetical protein
MTAATDVPRTSKRTAAERERNLTRVQARVASQRARADFAATLDALEDKLNVPKQVGRKVEQAQRRFRAFADERPVAAIAAAAGVAAAVGLAVWLVVRANLDR